jgi:hypothetical protein
MARAEFRERFSNANILTGPVESGFSGGKKPLGIRGFGAQQLENRPT